MTKTRLLKMFGQMEQFYIVWDYWKPLWVVVCEALLQQGALICLLFFSSLKSIYNLSYFCVCTVHLQCCWKCLWRELVLDIRGWIQWRLSAETLSDVFWNCGVSLFSRCAEETVTPPILLQLIQGHMCRHLCVNTDRGEPWGERRICFCLTFIMQGGCLSRRGCRLRGSKLIIQRAVNVSKASVGKLRRSKGLFQQMLLNIPELM